jgi:hypothetical protein
VDYLSIAPFGDPAPTHRALLGARVVIFEGLDLRAVRPGPVDLCAFPAASSAAMASRPAPSPAATSLGDPLTSGRHEGHVMIPGR